MTSPQLVVLGCPGHRRVTLFAAAARAAGLPEPAVLSWSSVLRGRYELPPDAVVRVDSPGEDPEADRLLRGAALGDGYAATRVEGGPAWYAGVTAALRELAARPGVRMLGDPEEIAVMFDKRRAHAVLAAAGVPVPPALPGELPSSFEELRERMASAGMRRVFLKPVHGSSASGVVALEFGPRGQVQATTSVEVAPDGLHNSLTVRRYRDAAEVAALVDRLAPEGLHVEQWVPKSGQRGLAADLRVLVVGGRATHVVVRTSRHPMTNLHLGGARGELASVRAAAGGTWPTLLATAEAAAGCFPHAPMVGVDLLPRARWRRTLVGEVNAFGDLLPKLPGLADGPAPGLDTYAAQLASPKYSEALRRSSATAPLPSPASPPGRNPCEAEEQPRPNPPLTRPVDAPAA
ncbi:STM4014 family protein [Kitasatospora sp. NPDC059673]|uniref:STM4014 family protein n=1 Tax=Kitasatospora sp. NPDC059673 TaxID=3346901 RepID=UPI0036A2E392